MVNKINKIVVNYENYNSVDCSFGIFIRIKKLKKKKQLMLLTN